MKSIKHQWNLLKFIENDKKYQNIYPKNRIFIKISSYEAENKSPGVFLHALLI